LGKSVAASAATKPKAGFATIITTKSMATNAATNTNAGEGLHPKSRDWILIEGGVSSGNYFVLMPPHLLSPNLRPALEHMSASKQWQKMRQQMQTQGKGFI